MAIKKHKLGSTDDFEFLLLGLASTENDYRLIWIINKALNFNFEKSSNHKIPAKNEADEIEFSQYTFEDEDSLLDYRFLANKSENGVLLDELKNIDYLLLVSGEYHESFITGLISGLKKIEHIQGVFRISPGSLKKKERLQF